MKITFEAPTTPQSSKLEPLILADSAALQIKKLKEKKQNDALFLRIEVRGGGCNGFSYILKLDDNIKEQDIDIENKNMNEKAVIDPQSAALLQGSTIEFVETLEASQFVINNPNAASSCGCGNSFSV